MSWKIELEKNVIKKLRKMDSTAKKRITKFIDALEGSKDPREKGAALTGKLGEYWKYRIGEYRLIVKIFDDRLIIVVVKVGNRKDIYRKK